MTPPPRFVSTPERIDHTLLAVAAHELRHPIHLMRLAIERYLPQPQDPARASIDRYVNQMARLVDDLVDFIRTEHDSLDLQLEWLDIEQVLTDLVAAYEPAFTQRRVRLSFAPTVSGGLWLNGDVHRLMQIFSNILDNCLKYTPAGGSVAVECTKVEHTMQVRVRDTGRGIAPEVLARVFEAPGSTGLGDGFGIGLAIARRIAALHGGELEVFSEGEGHGTEVLVTLPLLEQRAEQE